MRSIICVQKNSRFLFGVGLFVSDRDFIAALDLPEAIARLVSGPKPSKTALAIDLLRPTRAREWVRAAVGLGSLLGGHRVV